MGDLTSAISGIGDSIGNLFSSAPAAAADVGSAASGAPIDLGAGVPGIGAGAFGAASPIGTVFDPSTVFGGISDVGGAIDPTIAADMTGTLGDLGGIASQAANIPFQMPGSAPGQIGETGALGVPGTAGTPGVPAPTSGATAFDGGTLGTGGAPATMAPTQVASAAPTPVSTPATPVTPVTAPTGGGAAGGGGATAQGSTLAGAGGGEADILKPGPDLGTSGSGSNTGGGILDWLSNQLTGPGSLKNDLQMLAALGGLGMSAFKPNAIPGAGQPLSPSGTSTGQTVSNAQQQQKLASQEAATAAQQQQLAAEAAATQPQQEQIAQQQQGISAQQTAQAPPLLATGQAQVAAAAAGQLTPAQEAQVAAALHDNQLQIRGKYAMMGLSGSTMEQSDLNQANLQAQALRASLLNQNQTQGLNTVAAGQSALTGGGTSLQSASGDITAGVSGLTAGSQDINQAVNAFNQAASALGTSSGTYLNILQQQLAQDQDLQKALAQMASSLGTSTALSQLGNAASTAGTIT